MNPLPLKAAPWALLTVALAFGKCTYDGRRRAEGREAVEIQRREQVEDSLARMRTRVDTFYRVDTARLWRTVRRTETLIDTLRLSDTVVLTKRESVLVFVADSLIRQCRYAVQTCEARVRVRDSLLSTLTLDRNYWRGKSDPSLLTRMTTALKWAAIGYVAGKVTP